MRGWMNNPYNLAHLAVKKVHGSASQHTCSDCGERALDWTLKSDPTGPVKLYEGRQYSENTNDYEPRCPERTNPMPKFRKKPVVIDAVQLIDDLSNHIAVVQWVKDGGGEAYVTPLGSHIVISTLEGDMRADIGDYVIRGVQGEHYPCKPDIFEATYEPA